MKDYMKHLCVIFMLLFFFTSCDTKADTKIEFVNPAFDTVTNIKKISLIDLVKNYKLLDGQNIETEGIVYFEFENVAICLGNGRNSKCLWLDLNGSMVINDSLLQKASGQRFIVRGTLNNSDKGHLDDYLATIKNIYYLKSK